MDAAWETLFGCIAPLSMPWSEYGRNVWIFFSEPILLRGEPFDQRTILGGYDSFIQPALLIVLYVLALASAWMNRRHVLVKLMGAMFLVDVVIHFVVRWGLTECQLYGGHWMYVLPLLLGLGFRHLPRKARKCAIVGVWMLSMALFLCNVHGYFCHDVGFMSTKMRFGFAGDGCSVWVSRGWPFVRDVLCFAAQWLRGTPAARCRVAEWWLRHRGDPNW